MVKQIGKRMADLILLKIADQEPVRCHTVKDAETLAKTAQSEPIVLSVTPEGGGPMTTLTYDQSLADWVSMG